MSLCVLGLGALLACPEPPAEDAGSTARDAQAGVDAWQPADGGLADRSAGPDAASGPDSTILVDASGGHDGATATDASVAPDATAGPDAAAADVQAGADGASTPDSGVAEDAGSVDAYTIPVGAADIGPEGGELVSADGLLHLRVPPGAVSGAAVHFTVARVDQPPSGSVTHVYQLGPDDRTFDKALVVTLRYDPSSLGGTAEANLWMAVWDTGAGDWSPLNRSEVLTEQDVVVGRRKHLSRWSSIDLPSWSSRKGYTGFFPSHIYVSSSGDDSAGLRGLEWANSGC